MKQISLFLCFAGVIPTLAHGQDRDQRIADLERQLTEAKGSIAVLQKSIESLSSQVQGLRQPEPKQALAGTPVAKETGVPQAEIANEFAGRIIGPDNGSDERDSMFEAKPEIFIQTRYSVAPIEGSGTTFQPNLRLSRVETRWAGKINDRLGAGIEIQFQESVEGSPEKLINDAFLEYYLTDHATVRAGQFIKPFGFAIQQSSWLRESPERPIFSGYFFPEEWDRGIMLSGDLGFLTAPGFKDLQYFVGAFNGNRFFNDSNRQVNYMGRIRKTFNKKLAVGVSIQLGKQLLPPGISGNDNERLVGLDFQFTAGRLGLRGEALTGNMPSTPATIGVLSSLQARSPFFRRRIARELLRGQRPHRLRAL